VKFLLKSIQVGLMTRITGAAPGAMAYYLFVNNATFFWRATLPQIVALSTIKAEFMMLASCCCQVVWARKLSVELRFLQLKPTEMYKNNTGCIALAIDMHLRGCSKHVALHVYFIQQLIHDRIINAKQCPTAAQIAAIGTKALPRVPFESFTDQLLGDKHVDGKRFSFGLSCARVSAEAFKLFLLVSMVVVLCPLVLCRICCIIAYVSLSSF